ncbi:hypothetical protein GALMADRAFT_144648 [Galerina marginata CBS 339.88]|uniref:Uncharacterized protein n=1 Tax=Galerina marginata (strain CBS 339.88) TaxID=685588 RepID=A0A067SU85_GALM3|nr:hypothetical protein GALMADRAFT_144648 [Galerina marginata CBS 339.88]
MPALRPLTLIHHALARERRVVVLEADQGHLRRIYVVNIAYEYMHSLSKTEGLWFFHLFETQSLPSREGSSRSEVFDNFLQLEFPNMKPGVRYRLEDGESSPTALESLFSAAFQSGVQRIVLGRSFRSGYTYVGNIAYELTFNVYVLTSLLTFRFMLPLDVSLTISSISPTTRPKSPIHLAGAQRIVFGSSSLQPFIFAHFMPVYSYAHRGRLNLLTDILQYSPAVVFHKIKGGYEIPEVLGAEGDVLSHLAASSSNASHFEAVKQDSPSKTRANQFALLKTFSADYGLQTRRLRAVHAAARHASFAGQGVVMVSLGSVICCILRLVKAIGRTLPTSNARSSLYCSDVEKMINTPILNVNGIIRKMLPKRWISHDRIRATPTAQAQRSSTRTLIFIPTSLPNDMCGDLPPSPDDECFTCLMTTRWQHRVVNVASTAEFRLPEKIPIKTSSAQQSFEFAATTDDPGLSAQDPHCSIGD